MSIANFIDIKNLAKYKGQFIQGFDGSLTIGIYVRWSHFFYPVNLITVKIVKEVRNYWKKNSTVTTK